LTTAALKLRPSVMTLPVMKPLPGQVPFNCLPGHVPLTTSAQERSGTPPVAFLI
jgi:hypothetical protein